MSLFDWFRGKNTAGDLGASMIEPVPSLLPAPPPMSAPPPPSYSIENAIDLMRSLPFDENPELVLRVLRKTLRSTGVSVEQIIEAAKARENAVMRDGAEQQAAIEQLEQQILARREAIERLSATLQETKSARQRLEQAMESETKVVPVPPEVLRMHAEALATARAESTPLAPKSVPPAPKSSPPPVPKSVAPPPKSMAPPLPSKPPPLKPAPPSAPRSVRPPAVARADSALPSLADDGDEKTDKATAPNGGKE